MVRNIGVLLVIVIVGVSCRKESPYAVLSGSVYYEGIAIPVRGVRVKVDQNIDFSGWDGSYVIPEIRKGVYMLWADKEGFEPFYLEMEFLKDRLFQNIQMVSEVFTSKIYGNIFGDYNREPRVGLRCVVMNPNGTESRLESVTDTSGYYEIMRVPEGYHSLKVIDDTEVIYQEWIEVGLEDVNYDIVFPDVFMFEDDRDGKEYSALKIGGLSWMTENLAYLPYVDDPAEVSFIKKQYYVYSFEGEDVAEAKHTENYDKYGVLYNWRAAIDACPDGWRLPTDEDWKKLEEYLGMDESELAMDNWRHSGDIGSKLKDTVGWYSGESNNSSWFNAAAGGYIGYDGGFFGEGGTASFWTSVKCSDQFAWSRSLSANEGGVFRSCAFTRYGYSVRCVR